MSIEGVLMVGVDNFLDLFLGRVYVREQNKSFISCILYVGVQRLVMRIFFYGDIIDISYFCIYILFWEGGGKV